MRDLTGLWPPIGWIKETGVPVLVEGEIEDGSVAAALVDPRRADQDVVRRLAREVRSLATREAPILVYANRTATGFGSSASLAEPFAASCVAAAGGWIVGIVGEVCGATLVNGAEQMPIELRHEARGSIGFVPTPQHSPAELHLRRRLTGSLGPRSNRLACD